MRKKYVLAVLTLHYLLPVVMYAVVVRGCPDSMPEGGMAELVCCILILMTCIFGGWSMWLALGLQFSVRNRPVSEGAPRQKPLSLIFARAFACPTLVFPLFFGLCVLETYGVIKLGLTTSTELRPLFYGIYAHFIYFAFVAAIFIFDLTTRDAVEK